MPTTRIRRAWEVPERQVTPERMYWNRREFLQASGLGAIGGALAFAGCRMRPEAPLAQLGAPRNPKYRVERPLSAQRDVEHYNNFYEFSPDKEAVAGLTGAFRPRPWELEVRGLCRHPTVFDLDDLRAKFPLEERVYRHRCVEAWSFVVPWIGFPMAALLRAVEPQSSARFVRMVSFLRRDEAPGQRTQPWYPWPYFEALTLAEAMNELTLLVTGLYGRQLPKQNGAPIRLITPWKYGFKGIKSIVRIELTEKQPKNFWNVVAPDEYDFYANVDPQKPHPRWSQATERDASTGERIPTLPWNGYGEWVAGLYRT